MTLEQLRIFVAVAEREHVTRAAEALHLTQSAVSAAIQALERRHDTRLFDRVGRNVVLTEAGRALAQRARTRHEIVAGFLQAIGVDEATAREDAEGMEHHASETTLRAMQKMMNYLRKAGKLGG